MKILKLIVFVTLIHSAALAQKPEPIYSFAKVRYPIEWYKEQQTLWKAEIDKNQANARAWYYYFRASRVLTRLDENDKRSEDEKHTYLTGIVGDMAKAVPNTFEYNHAEWMVWGFRKPEKIIFLKKAAELAPENPEICSDMINISEMDRDIESRNKYAKLWFESGETSPGMLNYNYNVMAGLKQNAILITTGDNDTYPVWILQGSSGFRKDITVINTSLILMKEYREKLFKELGVAQISYDPFASDSVMKKFKTGLISVLAGNKTGRPLYIALTASEECNGEVIEKEEKNLYLTGLAYEYSTTPIDNMAVMKKNFEQAYALDYLDKYFVVDISAGMVKQLNQNYIVPLVKLYDHYQLAGQGQQADTAKSRALKLAAGTEQEDEVKKYFKK